jgi:signal transduction histidine kinase/ActR/RegA family two-component response regulator
MGTVVRPLGASGGPERGVEWVLPVGQDPATAAGADFERKRGAVMTTNGRASQNQGAAVGLFHWHLHDNRIASTPLANRLLGFPEAQPISFGELQERIHPEDRAAACAAVDEALAAAGECDLEFRVVLPDQRVRWIALIGTVARGPQGLPEHMAGVMLDVSERKHHESERDQLLEAERAARYEAERQARLKDEFLARLSHELRAPLTTMLGWAQILRRGNLPPAEMAEALKTIETSAQQQRRLIEDLLDMSRITSGKLRLDVEPLDLAVLAREALSSIRPLAEAEGIDLEQQIGGDLGPVLGDAARLQQVIWNLLSNAVKFTKPGGRVRLEARRETGRVTVTVSDTGVGVLREQLPTLFERYRQAAPAERGGLGLGLAIVKELCDLHGGTVHADSPGVGQGATFTVSFPIAALGTAEAGTDATHAAATCRAVACDPAALNGLRVLLVEDERDSRDIVARMLREYGMHVRTADSAQAALEMLDAEAPDVLISDIGMPHEDGYTLIRKVRQHRRERIVRLPAIALTALARPEDRARAIDAGYHTHIAKPVDPARLAQAVCRLTVAQHAVFAGQHGSV